MERVNGSKNDFATKICDVGEALRRDSEDLSKVIVRLPTDDD